jgi:cardiolipin synthase A/B
MAVAQHVPEELYFQADHYFEAVLEHIKQAYKQIEVEAYIFAQDALGQRIANALIDAAKRGVKVRIIVDGIGTPFWGGGFVRALEAHGIESRIFHPYPWTLWQWHRAINQSFFIFKFFYLLTNLNKRNHRKMFIIDDRCLFLGSVNISQCHLTHAKGGSGWRDTSIRITHVYDILLAREAFEAVWVGRYRHFSFHHYIAKKSFGRRAQVRFNHGLIARRRHYRRLLKQMSRAKKIIWLTNAYFIPEYQVLKRLQQSAAKGVDVRILLPKKSDVSVTIWASRYFYRALLHSGVRIFEYHLGMLHAKTMIIDQCVHVGSSNMNHRSLLHDLEVDLETRTPSTHGQLKQQFLQDLQHAEEIQHAVSIQPLYQRIIGALCLYIKFIF